jgi:hypothetical protein
MDWIGVAEDQGHWTALVNAVITIRLLEMLGSS